MSSIDFLFLNSDEQLWSILHFLINNVLVTVTGESALFLLKVIKIKTKSLQNLHPLDILACNSDNKYEK